MRVMSRLAVLMAVAASSACSSDSKLSLAGHEFVARDSAFGAEYRTRIQVDRDRGVVRELRLVSTPLNADRQFAGTAQPPEIEVWGAGGTFQPPIRSTCRIFDVQNWTCQNVNTGLVDARGNFLVVGSLEMRGDTLREAEVSGPPIVYRKRLRLFGRSPD
jgi:hypothetical protein